jgi:hypothetical protein
MSGKPDARSTTTSIPCAASSSATVRAMPSVPPSFEPPSDQHPHDEHLVTERRVNLDSSRSSAGHDPGQIHEPAGRDARWQGCQFHDRLTVRRSVELQPRPSPEGLNIGGPEEDELSRASPPKRCSHRTGIRGRTILARAASPASQHGRTRDFDLPVTACRLETMRDLVGEKSTASGGDL